ncbi:MAG: hypothetical protein ACXWP0_21640, partial [Ktedonobacterales bacterium]
SILTGFGTVWAISGVSNLPTSERDILLFAIAGVLVILVIANIRLWQHAGRVPAYSTPEEATYREKAGARFGLVFGGEMALIIVANIVLVITRHFTLITPAIALIVGIHFLPLAYIFRAPS